MKNLVCGIVSAFVLTALSVGCTQKEPPYAYSGNLIWQDEFDSDSLDTSKWYPMKGIGPDEGYPIFWGNNELQFYTAENAVVRDGYLAIQVKRENHGGMRYTSARLTTSEKFSFTYGRVEARIKMPAGVDGLWPAFWMLPDGIPEQWFYGTWAASGEIDIAEAKSRLPGEASGAAHFGGKWSANTYRAGTYTFPEGEDITDWHVYGVEWLPDAIIWYVDGIEYFRLTDWYTIVDDEKIEPPAPFDRPFCIILNVAVGGNFDGRLEPGDDFEMAEVLVDWVRVHQ